MTPGLWALVWVAVLAAVYLGIRWMPKGGASSIDSPPPEFTEIVAASGTVQVLESGGSEWQAAKTGRQLANGDLIRTDALGSASIRYPNGTTVSIPAETVFAVQRTGNNEMEILMPASPAFVEPGSRRAETDGRPSLARTEAGGLRPSLSLERIIPFGQSLELVGNVEPGSRLSINGETVQVEGDGAFKHFTNPFPKTAETVQIMLKATNLAGRTSTLTATHSFRSRPGDQ